MQKAAEDLKQQQLLKEQERQRILKERIIPLPDVETVNNQGTPKIVSRIGRRKSYFCHEKKFPFNFF